MDILLTDVQKWYASKINKQVEELDSYDLFCAKVAYDYHTEQCNIANVVGRSEQCKHLESDLIRNNSAGFKCKCGKEVTYF